VLASLLQVHEGFAWFVIVGNGLAGLWSLGAHWKPSLRSRALWWFTGVVQLAIFVQVMMGVGLVAGQGLKAPQFHMFYGFVAIAAVGIIYSYRHQLEQYRYLLYGGGGLFLMGLGIRAMLVGTRAV
jgi:hypothetical protein